MHRKFLPQPDGRGLDISGQKAKTVEALTPYRRVREEIKAYAESLPEAWNS